MPTVSEGSSSPVMGGVDEASSRRDHINAHCCSNCHAALDGAAEAFDPRPGASLGAVRIGQSEGRFIEGSEHYQANGGF